ncbi:hypothetical protein AGABI2DRAFT_142336 [Agaricus bisporus var. bisporus H97]|uniref:hypothetical protein n=1 Tax=Agaricus bisporus var. bisporus (strain H97 / ATCC MYA-4626 / FGSC 10389) TaxID=936046 RepID=UPI00029F699C|nr:hypothetical protein AGABI2DRAFT_142336 [Agaricus bisporus var. bisporus H97]EKV48095.1 hypothetical protein AGABI2DRAFT_142336 [Agaricus bisporus var. bisporus H97]
MHRLLSSATVTLVGLSSKALVHSGFASVAVHGLSTLTAALDSPARDQGQGIITVANHISTLDDPLMWSVLPAHYYLSPRTTRWALGASEIMFTNPWVIWILISSQGRFFSTFFRLGQTIETFRGKGIAQPAVDLAIEKLNTGGWVHLYGEGKVNQSNTYQVNDNGQLCLKRFKWGVGRIVMESKKPPVIIPTWITGFDKLMPEGRKFPYKFFPRPGAELSVTFGQPLSADSIRRDLGVHLPLADYGSQSGLKTGEEPGGWLGTEVQNRMKTAEGLSHIRTRVTGIIHDAVENLGRSVSARLLDNNRI